MGDDNIKNTAKKLQELAITTISTVLQLVILFIVGVSLLFSCKVYASGIVPTNFDCSPYTSPLDSKGCVFDYTRDKSKLINTILI